MNTKFKILFTITMIFAITVFVPSNVFATTQIPESMTTSTSLGDGISLEETATIMIIPEDNTLPWGAVKGMITNPVERYPIIIQFIQNDEPAHVAQVDVKGDDSFEYKFRVRNIDSESGKVINIFEGQYTVKIFKVVHKEKSI